MFTPQQQSTHELNRLIDNAPSSSSSSNRKKRPAMRMRLLNIFKNKSKAFHSPTSQHHNLLRRNQHEQQIRQQQLELATLGTIELNSLDELKFGLDDDEVDDNHGLSSCGSAMQLTQMGALVCGDDSDDRFERYSSLGSLSSKSQGEVADKAKGDIVLKDKYLPKEYTVSFEVGLKQYKKNIPEEKITDYEERIISLFQTGKELYANGSYKHALKVQKDALRIIHRKGLYAKKEMDLSWQHGKQIDVHKQQKAMIQYEIAKIEFVIYKEQSYNNSSDSDDDTQSRLTQLFDRMQDAKCKVTMQDLIYYQDLLAQIESDDRTYNTMAKSDQEAKPPFHKARMCQKIEILNNLGKICQKFLHRYEDALRYYKVALELECCYLNHIMHETDNENENNNSNKGDEIDEWKMKIRQTKQKIGAIHYVNGRFDMALLSSFSDTKSYSDSSSSFEQG